jgi:hypothetical protein
LGMAAVTDGPNASGYPLYAEAMNEKGLCMAGLRFAESAVYAPRPCAGFLNLAPWELIPYLLAPAPRWPRPAPPSRIFAWWISPFRIRWAPPPSIGTSPTQPPPTGG